jgi:hypothetical protein
MYTYESLALFQLKHEFTMVVGHWWQVLPNLVNHKIIPEVKVRWKGYPSSFDS